MGGADKIRGDQLHRDGVVCQIGLAAQQEGVEDREGLLLLTGGDVRECRAAGASRTRFRVSTF